MSSKEVMVAFVGTVISAAAFAALLVLAPLYVLRDLILLPFYAICWLYRNIKYSHWLDNWVRAQNDETLKLIEEYIDAKISISSFSKYDETSLTNIYNIYNSTLKRKYVPDLFKQKSIVSHTDFVEQLDYFAFKVKKLKFTQI